MLETLFHQVKFEYATSGGTIGNKTYATQLTTGGRTLSLTVQERMDFGIALDGNVRRIRVRATKDIRQLPKRVTHVSIGTDRFGILQQLPDTVNGYVDFFLESG